MLSCHTNLSTFSLIIISIFRLDRETEHHFRLHVLAWDGATSSRTGTLTIDVQVLDANDNQPKFENETYEVTVSENVGVGTSLLQVRATDADAGENSRVTYSLAHSTIQQFGSMFVMDSDSGVLSTGQSLDRDGRDAFRLTVEATDQGIVPFVDFADVIVVVIDENDNAPVVVVNAFSTSGAVEIPENSEAETFVAQILVTDPDVGSNGFTECSIQPETNFELRQPFPGEYQLIARSRFDRELIDHHGVILQCSDRGEPPLTTRQPITITVTDVNDNAPAFAFRQYNVTIHENNALGQHLTSVHAFDPDLGPNAEIRYSLADCDVTTPMVSVNAETGDVYAASKFDREKQSVHK